MARRRRRWGIRFGLVVILVIILGWQGWGLVPWDEEDTAEGNAEVAASPEDPEPQDDAQRQDEEDVPPAATTELPRDADRDRGADATPVVGGGGGAQAGDPGAGDAGAGDAGAAETETAVGDAEIVDRLASLQELIREAVATDRLGDGFMALEDLEAITREAGPQALRAEGRQVLGNALTATVLKLREHLSYGRVLEARRLLSALRGTPHPRVVQALDMMATGEGWPPLGAEPGARGDIPEPSDLVGERRVLVEWQDEIVPGRIVECRPDRVTVRMQRETGVVFPEVRRVLVAPVNATAAEAVQQGLVALRAGNRDLAWLWLCRAHAAGAAGDVVRQLARLVGG